MHTPDAFAVVADSQGAAVDLSSLDIDGDGTLDEAQDACVRDLLNRRSEVTFTLTHAGQVQPIGVVAGHSIEQAALPDGRIAAIVNDTLAGDVPDSCLSVTESLAADRQPRASLQFIDTARPDRSRAIPVPDELSGVPIEQAVIRPSGSALFVVLNETVWSFELLTDEWTQLGTIPGDDFSQLRFTPAGRLVGVREGDITIVDYPTGEVTTEARDLTFSPRIVYIDDELALVSVDMRPGTILVEFG